MMNLDAIVCADALDWLRTLPDASVNCIITSPPYFNLRSYLPDNHPAKNAEIGLEDTLPAFIARLVAVFREARRVLRSDGTLWVNMGDSYSSGGRTTQTTQTLRAGQLGTAIRPPIIAGIKPKDLMGVPWRLAFALQDDGWYLRSDIIWHKPNPMPESVTDRPTKSHEYVFLLTKSATYWYDGDAIREDAIYGENRATFLGGTERLAKANVVGGGFVISDKGMDRPHSTSRNRRSVWSISTEPSKFPHYASFPQKLVEPMILAGCPSQVCAECGAPYERVTNIEFTPSKKSRGKPGNGTFLDSGAGNKQGGWNDYPALDKHVTTLGFRPTCACDTTATRPGVVLDMFAGTGTTGVVARRLGRHYLLCDLSPEYVDIANRRLAASDPYQDTPLDDGSVQLSLFANHNGDGE